MSKQSISQDALLIELGTEELPPKALRKLSQAFTTELIGALQDAELIGDTQVDDACSYATPRRLALLIPGVRNRQPDQVIERRGPAVQAAFKDNGEPTPAALGFAGSCGVDVADLARLKTEKGEWLAYTMEQAGKDVVELIPGIIDQAIRRLPIPKRMRWGDNDAEFVRPVHWLIVMLGEAVIPATVLGVSSSNKSLGHRFHSDGELTIGNARDYATILADSGQVIASFEERQALISGQLQLEAEKVGGRIEADQDLLDEVTGLVEYPVTLLGEFDEDFLQVPHECLISSMRDHQKYFHVVDDKGRLMANFLTVSNIRSAQPDRVKEGNERVLRARLSDARFFWESDKNTPLESLVDRLDSVLFHARLGSVLDKSHRIQKLSGLIATQLGADKSVAERGALLAKADLVSNMVGEFDELQGIMGHYYADSDGEDPKVGNCIEQHYWPKYAGDRLPDNLESQAVALADRLDSLVGIYAAGEVPTGDKDPYALRRAALAILRILIEQKHPQKLADLVAMTAQVYDDTQSFKVEPEAQQQIVDFVLGRLTSYYQSQGIATTVINAVLACKPDSPLDFEYRLKAVDEFGDLAEAADLAAANKRIRNILKKQASEVAAEVDPQGLIESAEIELHQAIESIQQDCLKLFDRGDYSQGLMKLAALRTPVDDFFEHVMVMSEDPAQRQNRLALLNALQQLFLRVADISLLQAQDVD